MDVYDNPYQYPVPRSQFPEKNANDHERDDQRTKGDGPTELVGERAERERPDDAMTR